MNLVNSFRFSGFDWDVQRYSVNRDDFSGSEPSEYTFTLDTPVPVGESFIMIGTRSGNSVGENVFPTAELITDVSGNWTEVYVRIAGTDTFQNNHEIQVVTSPFFSVQKVVDYTATDSTMPVTETISSVDTSKTFLVGSVSTGDAIDETATMFELTNSTTVSIEKDTDFGAKFHYCIYAVEIEAGGASVTHGTVDITGTSATVNPAASDNTFCLFTWMCTNRGDADEMVRGAWNSNTEYEWHRNNSTGTTTVSYFFVTLPNTTNERLSENAGDFLQDTNIDVTISSTVVEKTFIAHGGYMNNTSLNSTESERNAFVTQALSDSTTVHLQRMVDDGNADVLVELQIVEVQ